MRRKTKGELQVEINTMREQLERQADTIRDTRAAWSEADKEATRLRKQHAGHEPLRSVRQVTLVEVVVARGAGIGSDPMRLVTMLFDAEVGNCVAEHDPHYPTPWYGARATQPVTRRDSGVQPGGGGF